MAYAEHQCSAADVTARCAVVTLSDTRTSETDTSGRRIRELIIEAKHAIADQQIIPDDPAKLSTLLDQLLAREDIDVILTNGGTGISRRDTTIETVEKRIDRPLPGFGELFRMLSWDQIGPGAMLSRAVGGVATGKLIFAMPGSTKAVELAMSRLILPELKHLLAELRK